ncbi:MAG: hypothetical protein IPL40_09475 [Proteobacteria bacterium]|nr:hypothetical protein [Pseudomonadota bacterium]
MRPPRLLTRGRLGRRALAGLLTLSGVLAATPAGAQYAVGHRTFGAGSAGGVGAARLDLDFTDLDASPVAFLLPTVEFKVFLGDQLSLDASIPVGNIAASNALKDYFLAAGEVYLGFHPSAPGAVELFVAPGLGFSFATHEYALPTGRRASEEAWAFHVPVRLGVEFNSDRRNFSLFLAARPFFNLIHGARGDINPGGGVLLELGVMAYATRYRPNRY